MYQNMYNLAWVKTACEHVLGKNISPRTWRNCLRICGVQPYKREIKLKYRHNEELPII
ncbi:hypothetical protein [Nostoc sp.]|uniref:hypothetical protein n=1 Tax=Nostoc sp. TaxID=1180 RepID=UPI002FF8B909